MFKTASDNSQSRVRRAAVESRKNAAPVDWSAFDKSEMEIARAKLVKRKREIEGQLRKTAALLQMSESQRSAFAIRTSAPKNVAERWISERGSLKMEMAEIESELGKIKFVMTEKRAEQELEFERMFIKMAKEMLAGPIYDRILRATIHASGGEAE